MFVGPTLPEQPVVPAGEGVGSVRIQELEVLAPVADQDVVARATEEVVGSGNDPRAILEVQVGGLAE